MSDFTDEQITFLRRAWIRDEWREDLAKFRGISDFNVSESREFFSDDDIKAMDAELSDDWNGRLNECAANEAQDFMDAGGSSDDADAFGAAQRVKGRQHLVAGEALRRMSRDPSFRRAFKLGKLSAEEAFGGMESEAKYHFGWVQSRTDGVQVER